MSAGDQLDEMFKRQTRFMELLRDHGKMPQWPLDLKSKSGQKLIKECIFNTIEELAEASFTLKNKQHRISDVQEVDEDHYCEELVDAMSFLMEICILSGFSADKMFSEYCKKNAVVTKRLQDGY